MCTFNSDSKTNKMKQLRTRIPFTRQSNFTFFSGLIVVLLAIIPVSMNAQTGLGPHLVGFRDINFTDSSLSEPSVSARVYHPAINSGINQPLAPGSFPSIAFGHGFNIGYLEYENLCTHLASHGYIVISPDVQNGFNVDHQEFARELVACISFLQTEGATPSSDFYNVVSSKTGVYGHSMGGGASFLVPSELPTIDAICGLAAAETTPSAIAALSSYSSPFMVISGSEDNTAPPASNQELMYDEPTGPKIHVSIVGGAHCKFTDGSTICDFVSSAGSITREEQQKITNRYTTGFFNYFLKDSLSGLVQICGDSLGYDIDNGIVTAQSDQIVCVIGLEEDLESKSNVVFPNPSDGTLNIKGVERALLKDISGKTIRELEGNSSGIHIDLSYLEKGVYWIYLPESSELLKWVKW